MLTITGKNIESAAGFLTDGSVVAIPTETVYGLAGNALDEKVVLSIFKLKQRPAFDPLIVHIHSVDDLNKYVKHIPAKAELLLNKFWPGPLTLLFEKKEIIPDIVTSGLNTVAIRIPSHPLTTKLLSAVNFPLAAPSANPFGYVSPTSANHVASHFSGKIPYILDGGACKVGIESTIVGFENDKCIVYRLGGIAVSEIEKCVGRVDVNIVSTSNPLAPGLLKSHYAPRKPMYFNDDSIFKFRDKKIALICFQKAEIETTEHIQIFELSAKGNLDEAASRLFAVLRELDESDFDIIAAKKFPDTGLGKAINDRLKRAAEVEK